MPSALFQKTDISYFKARIPVFPLRCTLCFATIKLTGFDKKPAIYLKKTGGTDTPLPLLDMKWDFYRRKLWQNLPPLF